jgi:hypothetical protein
VLHKQFGLVIHSKFDHFKGRVEKKAENFGEEKKNNLNWPRTTYL